MFKDNFEITHIYGENLIKDFDLNEIQIIDIREPFEIQICSIPESLKIPMHTLLSSPNKFLDTKETYYILCHTGQRSYYTTSFLQEKGYNVVNIIGGIASIDDYNVPY